MNLAFADYMRVMRGCFLGKTIGGTLGMPYEGDLGTREVTYYDPVPTSMVPNDDLDLQVVNLEILRRRGLPVCSHYLAEFWTHYMAGFPDEYGVANHNVSRGLYPPLSGYYSNAFHGGMGAAIRSELWACLAPGDPVLAVRLAREDASTDHANDGIDASAFLAAIESAAFIEKDRDALLETGFSFIGHNHCMTNAFRDVIRWWKERRNPKEIRKQILAAYPSQNWTDVTVNLSLILLSWLASEGDFGRGICTAASLGYDADCTCATLGAILGMIAPERIEEKWTRPIGRELALSPCIVGSHEPETIDEFMNMVAETCVEVQRYYGSVTKIAGDLPTYGGASAWTQRHEIVSCRSADSHHVSLLSVSPLAVRLVYPEGVAVVPGERTAFSLELGNPLEIDAQGWLELIPPEGWMVSPAQLSFNMGPGEEQTFAVDVTAPRYSICKWRNPLDIRIHLCGQGITTTAGLIQAIPFQVQVHGKEISAWATSNVLSIPEGTTGISLEFKAARPLTNMRMLAQGTLPLCLRLNGQEISRHGNEFYLPAFHRNPDSVRVDLPGGWNRVEIDFPQPASSVGEVFFGVAEYNAWQWINTLEYRLPGGKEG